MWDGELARRIVVDLTDPARGVLVEQRALVEARTGALVRDLLSAGGWQADEPWTPLCRELTEPVPDLGVRIELIGSSRAQVRVAVHRE